MTLRLLVASFCTCVALALPAVASASEFNADAEGAATLAGAQVEKMTLAVDGSKVECSTAKFSGTLAKPSEQVTLHPTLSGCLAFGFTEAKVTTTGCDFVFHVGEVVKETKIPGSEYKGTADIACEAGKSINITASTCEVTIGGQTGITGVTYKNRFEATPEEFFVESSEAGLVVNKTKDGFLCPLAGTGTTTGHVSGRVLTEVTAGGKKVGVRVGHTSAAWIVAGTYLGPGASATTTFTNLGAFVFRVPAIPVKVSCGTFTGKQVMRGGIPGGGEFKEMNIAGCAAQEPAGCSLAEYGWQSPWAATLEPGASSVSFIEHLSSSGFRIFFRLTGIGCPAEEIFFVGEPRLAWLNGTSTVQPDLSFTGAQFTSVSGVPATISGLLEFSDAEGGGKVWGERVGVP